MAFQRADGQPLQVGTRHAARPELTDLAGATFIVNGRPFSGTGVGYNPLAAAGQPRLNARAAVPDWRRRQCIGAEIALLPNSRSTSIR